MRRPPRPQDNDGDNDDCDDNDDDRGAVETNAGKSNGSDCYLARFDNKTIWYVVGSMVE